MIKSSRRPRLLVGVVVAAVAAATVATIGSATSASADPATRLTIAPATATASAGTCIKYTVAATDAFGNPATPPAGGAHIFVTLTESPASDTQDVDFCTVAGSTTPVGGVASYDNAPQAVCTPPSACPTRQNYTPGPSVNSPAYTGGTGATPAPGSNADSPDGAKPLPAQPKGDNNANPSGTDFAAFDAASGTVIFGVAGLTTGGATIDAFYDSDRDGTKDTGPPAEIAATQARATFTKGGAPGSPAAANAVTVVDAEPEDNFVKENVTTTYFTQLRNESGNSVAGVKPDVIVTSKPAGSLPDTACGVSNNEGVSTCTFQSDAPNGGGVYDLLVYVNQTTGTPTTGPDDGEPRDAIRVTVTRTAVPEDVDRTRARYIDLKPDTTSTVAGDSRPFTASVASAEGQPVMGAQVTFTESGPGTIVGGNAFSDGTSTQTATTDDRGIAAVIISTATSDRGTQTINATLPEPLTANTGCRTPAAPPVPAGNCADSSTNTVAPAPSPSPSPSASTSASPSATASSTASASATPTATMSASASSSSSATSTGTPSSSPSSAPTCRATLVTVNTKTINATGLASVTVTGAAPGSTVQVQGYSQNHFLTATFDNDPTPVDRTVVTDSNGAATVNDIRPASNTRLRARMTGCTYGGTDSTDVINVRAQETLQVTRNGVRKYTFSGVSIPARPGGLIVSLYRITGTSCAAGVEPRDCPSEVLIAQDRAEQGSSDSGSPAAYSVTLTLPASYGSSARFVVKTGRDAQNAPGRSNARTLSIF